MANIKSAIKRNKQNETRRLRNRIYLGGARSLVKKARTAIEDGEAKNARQVALEAISALDRAAGKGIIHKNNASRRKSRLIKRLAALEKQST